MNLGFKSDKNKGIDKNLISRQSVGVHWSNLEL